MRTFVTMVAAVFALVGSMGSAHALDQKKHRQVTEAACLAVGLPDDFCERAGVEAYNVDAYEWNDLAAHAQTAPGQSRCQAANATLDRVRRLGGDTRRGLAWLASSGSEDDANFVATQLGRALHTVQDACTHHGISNPQHAWYSLSDACDGTAQSPDLAPAALDCARRETAAVMAAFKTAVDNAGVDSDQLDEVSHGWTHYPSRGDVCTYLKSAPSWNGVDGQWDDDLVGPYVLDQHVYALTTGDDSLGDMCAAGPNWVAPLVALPNTNVSSPPDWCWKLNVYCVGKGDGADEADEPPPWVDPAAEAVDEVPAPQLGNGGCSVAAASSAGGVDGAATLLLFLAVAIVAGRMGRRGGRGGRQG